MEKFFNHIAAKFNAMDSLTKAIFIAFLLLAITTGIIAFTFVRNLTASMTILDLPGAPVLENSSAGEGKTPDEGQADLTLMQPTTEPWDGISRVTILILGLDYRDWLERPETPRSDTMILVTLDPANNTIGMLSIPRDIWVNVPSFGYYKINEAYFLGESYHLPGGGPALAIKTVEHFIGVPIQFYAQIDFNAFMSFIDEIGGIIITPEQDIEIEEFAKHYEQVLKAGQQYTLPGSLAISYARDRHTGDGDFGRAKRQQQVIIAIRDRILQYHEMPKLIKKAPTLYNELSTGIRTNLNLQQAIQLASLAMQVPLENIQKDIIDANMIIQARSPDGLSILIPIPDRIRMLRDKIFATGGAAGPIAIPGENSTLVCDEAAKVLVQNGTLTSGLAERTAEYLREQGIDATNGNVDQTYGATQIFIYSAKPHTVAYLANLMKVAPTNIWNKFDPNAGIDISVILGSDWLNNNPLP